VLRGRGVKTEETRRFQNAAKKPPGGRRIGHAEHERRLQLVAQILAAGHSRAALVEMLTKKFGMAERTTDDYIAAVKQRWAAAGAAQLEEHRGRMMQRLDDLGIKLEQKESWVPLVQVERLKGDILGVRRPFEVAISTPKTESTALDEKAIKLCAVLRAITRRAMADAANGDPTATRALATLSNTWLPVCASPCRRQRRRTRTMAYRRVIQGPQRTARRIQPTVGIRRGPAGVGVGGCTDINVCQNRRYRENLFVYTV
jgi:hypothetical protein